MNYFKLFLLSVAFITSLSAQSQKTYYYEYQYSIDQNGVKSQDVMSNAGRYLTYSNNYNNCYWSDKNGNAKTGYDTDYSNITGMMYGFIDRYPYQPHIFKYEMKKNGETMYICYRTRMEMYPMHDELLPKYGIIVSSDKNILQVFVPGKNGRQGKTLYFKWSNEPSQATPAQYF